MKNKLVLLTILLVLAVISAACAAQQSTEAPGEVTTAPTVSTDNSTATEDAGATVPTPTGAQEESTSVPGTEETVPRRPPLPIALRPRKMRVGAPGSRRPVLAMPTSRTIWMRSCECCAQPA